MKRFTAASAATIALAIGLVTLVGAPAHANAAWNNLVGAMSSNGGGYAGGGGVVVTGETSDTTITIAGNNDVQFNSGNATYGSLFAAPMFSIPAGKTLTLLGSSTGTFTAANGQCLFSGAGDVRVFAGTLVVGSGSTAFCNTGTVTIEPGATISLSAGAKLMSPGVTLNSHGTITGDSIEIPGGSSFESFGSAVTSVNNVVLSGTGSLATRNSSTLHVNTKLTVGPEAHFDSASVFTCDGDIHNQGQINSSHATTFQVDGSITNDGALLPKVGIPVTGGIVNNGSIITNGATLTAAAVTVNNFLVSFTPDASHAPVPSTRIYAAKFANSLVGIPVIGYTSGDAKVFESWKSTAGSTVDENTLLAGIASGVDVALTEQSGSFETVLPIAVGVPSTGYSGTAPTTFQWKVGGTNIVRTGSTTATITPLATDLGATFQLQVRSRHPAGYYPSTTTAQLDFAPVVAAPVITVPEEVAAGSALKISGTGFGNASTYRIELHSTPVVLGSVTTSASGAFSTSFAVPRATTAAAHQIVVFDRYGNVVATAALTVTVPPLPATGVSATIGYVALGAGGGILLGMVLFCAMAVARRRSTVS